MIEIMKPRRWKTRRRSCLLPSLMFLRPLSSSPTTSRLIFSSRLISRNRFIHSNNFNRTSQPTRQSRLTRISISATAALFSTSTQLNNQQQQSDNMAPVSTNGTSNGSQKKHKVVSRVQDSLIMPHRVDQPLKSLSLYLSLLLSYSLDYHRIWSSWSHCRHLSRKSKPRARPIRGELTRIFPLKSPLITSIQCNSLISFCQGNHFVYIE